MRIGVVIVCAGQGLRLGKGDKATLNLADKPLFYHTFCAFKGLKEISQIVLVLRKKNFSLAKQLICDRRLTLVEGGVRRRDSVGNGLGALGKNITHVLIHDGARPFASQKLIKRTIQTLGKSDAVICGVSCQDAIKSIGKDKVKATLSRSELVRIQTPQGFKKSLILKAYKALGKADVVDDAQAVELLGGKVKVIRGEANNIKITYPQDVKYAQTIIGADSYRIGLGFDVHRFSRDKKKLILADTLISSSLGLEAVSDGDVILHAVADGICGAAGLGDIGDYFPPQAAKSKGIRSKKILTTILADIKGKFLIDNIDITIMAEKPRLKAHKSKMIRSLKKIFGQIPINVKIKSKEGLDILGGVDSISCVAVVLVKQIFFHS